MLAVSLPYFGEDRDPSNNIFCIIFRWITYYSYHPLVPYMSAEDRRRHLSTPDKYSFCDKLQDGYHHVKRIQSLQELHERLIK